MEDTFGSYDTSTGVYIVNESGFYQINCQVTIDSADRNNGTEARLFAPFPFLHENWSLLLRVPYKTGGLVYIRISKKANSFFLKVFHAIFFAFSLS